MIRDGFLINCMKTILINMKNFILLLTTFLSSLFVSGQCHYVVDMQDSYGDGWNGASIDVSVNGTTVANMTCSGSASIDSIDNT